MATASINIYLLLNKGTQPNQVLLIIALTYIVIFFFEGGGGEGGWEISDQFHLYFPSFKVMVMNERIRKVKIKLVTNISNQGKV